jgi:hypothetical protein
MEIEINGCVDTYYIHDFARGNGGEKAENWALVQLFNGIS